MCQTVIMLIKHLYTCEVCNSSAFSLLQLDILLNGNPVDALAVVVHKDKAQAVGKGICVRLKEKMNR